MVKEFIKDLIDVSPFDTARNVYYLLLFSKELHKSPEELAGCIKKVRTPKLQDVKFAKLLFDALADCSTMEEQMLLLDGFFSLIKEDKTPYESLALALNKIESHGIL